MYLKSLTVLGFKSFADKTSLNFQPGITAIVGPNGCGKSNVADAIRWVLGEQSAKALRGGEMADVIFNGTDGRKPLALAEVSLTIGDVDSEHLQAAGVELSYNEVTVTRRVFRDGGSEYYINRTPCRLKDIQQLFMGTGVGRTSYSIMAQGNITQILSSKPEDRRMVFEEAAGITKFKTQKREALRKLEYTEQNLLRVGDLIREVKRQIGSLQRQAGKARRYKQLQGELQHLDTQLARHQFDVLQAEIDGREAAVAGIRAAIEDCSNGLLRGENELAQLRDELSELEHAISESQHRGLELKGEADRHESRIHFNEQRLHELERQHGNALGEISQAEERRLAAEQEIASLAERRAGSARTLGQQREVLRTRAQALEGVEQLLAARQEAVRQSQAELFSTAQQLARVRNEINALDLHKQGNVARLEKLSAEKIQLEEERTRLEHRLEEFAAGVEAEKQTAQDRRGGVEERQRRLREVQSEIDAVSAELDGVFRRQAEVQSRLAVIEQLEAGHEGFGAGALAALRKAQQGIGSLAEKIWVPDEDVPAVEASLGHHLQLLITEEPATAGRVLSELQQGRLGRASIAALALHSQHPTASTDPEEGPGEPALKRVVADPSVRPLITSLLGRTRLVPDLETATRCWQEAPGRFDFVTRSGDLLSRHGVYTGGAQTVAGEGRAPSSILGRKNQIAELRRQLAEVQTQIAELSRRKGAGLSERTELQAGLQQAQTELRAQEVAIATREGEFNALQNSLRILHQKIDTVVYEIRTLATQDEEAAQRRQGLSDRVGGLEAREAALQQQLGELNAETERLRQQRESAQADLTEIRVTVATEEQLAHALERQQGPLDQRLRELGQLVENRRAEVGGFIQRRAQAESEIEESRQRIGTLGHEREQVGSRTAALTGERETLAADVGERDENLRNERRRLGELQQQRAALDVELAQKRMAVQNLRERVLQKYQVNLDDVRSECITITIADEGPARIRTLTPDEMAAGGASTDWGAVGEQVAALQQRLDEMGPVNLVAIEEYEETEQRHQFLSRQHEDLVQAKAQLLEVINRINTQTREMFVATFNRIRDNFQGMFVEVFGGGKADLRLVDEGDVLESGIDIVARPPGKQLQTISLLSGGEQTMTAVALLFAIYQVKPSPFCVLDELDAPLDESNINRFIRILQRFLAHSQFIIITHNKRTIGMADVLYGVTMEEHGISKIVSVKFHKVGEAVLDHAPTPLVPPAAVPTVDAEEDSPHRREETIEIALVR